jgi:hypothetical protein
LPTVAALLAATVVLSPPARAQTPLAFLGLEPGQPRPAVTATVQHHQGEWNCRRSTMDARFTECRGRLAPAGEPRLDLIASLVRDSVAVLLLSGTVAENDLRRWRTALEAEVGPAAVRQVQGQTVWQWVRARKMIRITSRAERGTRTVSVSLVDGVLLDGLGGPGTR